MRNLWKKLIGSQPLDVIFRTSVSHEFFIWTVQYFRTNDSLQDIYYYILKLRRFWEICKTPQKKTKDILNRCMYSFTCVKIVILTNMIIFFAYIKITYTSFHFNPFHMYNPFSSILFVKNKLPLNVKPTNSGKVQRLNSLKVPFNFTLLYSIIPNRP